MSIQIAKSLVLAKPVILHPDNPVLGWRSAATISNVTASSEAAGFPASLMTIPNTTEKWKAADAGAQTIAIAGGSGDLFDYVGLARHNLGSAGIALTVSGQRTTEAEYSPLAVRAPADDRPVLLRWPVRNGALRLSLSAGSAPAQIAVLFAGRLTVFRDGVEPGYVAPPYGRVIGRIPGRSTSGEFLGSIVTGEHRQSSIKFSELDRDWYRSTLDPFIAYASFGNPFFYCWHPATFPGEAGFATLGNQPVPLEGGYRRVSIQLDMAGVA